MRGLGACRWKVPCLGEVMCSCAGRLVFVRLLDLLIRSFVLTLFIFKALMNYYFFNLRVFIKE